MPCAPLTVITFIGIMYNRGCQCRTPGWLCGNESHSLGFPMQRFECPPTSFSDRDAANFDSLVARLNGLTLDGRELATEEAA